MPAVNLLDVLSDAIALTEDLARAETPASIPEQAALLALIDRLRARLNDLDTSTRDSLVAAMESDEVETPHGHLIREKLPPSVSRDNKAAWSAVRRGIVDRMATDPITGERRRQIAALTALVLDEVETAMSLGQPKVAARRLGVDPKDYVAETPRGVTVKLVPVVTS